MRELLILLRTQQITWIVVFTFYKFVVCYGSQKHLCTDVQIRIYPFSFGYSFLQKLLRGIALIRFLFVKLTFNIIFASNFINAHILVQVI